jgi:transposase
VLVTGLPWRSVPQQIGCSGVTAWRRLRDWQAAGVWVRLHRELLRRLNAARRLDWSVGVVDGSHIRALRGGPLTGPSPVDRARTGSKHHLIVDRHGVPLGVALTGGNRNDVMQLLPLVDGIGAIAGKRGRPRQRPDLVIADRGYDHDKYRRELWRRGVKPVIARRATEHGSGLGRLRWVVERTFAWLHNFRRLRIRWERDASIAPGAAEPRMRTHLLATPRAVNARPTLVPLFAGNEARQPRCSLSTAGATREPIARLRTPAFRPQR